MKKLKLEIKNKIISHLLVHGEKKTSENSLLKSFKARLVELVDTSDLKSDSNESIGSSPITSIS